MKHLIWFRVALAMLMLVMPTRPALAQNQVQPPQDEYDSLLQNYGSRLCLQPEQEAPINGVAIVQQPCNGKDLYQRWHFLAKRLEYQKPGIYWITNSGSGQCLDDRDGKTADWSPVQQWTCNTSGEAASERCVTTRRRRPEAPPTGASLWTV